MELKNKKNDDLTISSVSLQEQILAYKHLYWYKINENQHI